MNLLHNLIEYNQIDELKNELKKIDIDLNLKNKYGSTPFLRAC